MSIEVVDGVRTLSFDMIAVAALAGVLLMLGYAVRGKIRILEYLCIPAPVIGGFICAIIIWILRGSGAMVVSMDTTLQLPFMLAFFTCVGFGGSFASLKTGGRLLIVFLAACWILAVLQCAIGVGLATALGLHPVLGVMAGTVSLVGGHGNAAAFGPVAEELGVQGATTVAVAAATFGLVIGNLTGGPIGDWLIRKNKIEIKTDDVTVESKSDNKTEALEHQGMFTLKSFLTHFTLILIFMFGGVLIAGLVGKLKIENFALPNYVGAMFLAIIFRNINDKKAIIRLDNRIINLVLEVGLSFFLTMAIMTLRVWELVDLAGPLLVILMVQFIVLLIFSVFVVFPMLGKHYDGAVMTGGFAGWGMGISATAVVCMSAICEKYQLRSTKAFMIAPLCGAVFVDIVAIPTIIFFITRFS